MAAKKVAKTSEEKVEKKVSKVIKSQSNKATKPSTSLRATAKQSRGKTAKVTHSEIAAPVSELVRNDVKKSSKKESALKVSVYDIQGKEVGTITLPEKIFGVKINPVLMAQAVRVYLANQRQGNASTKTRGEVTGSTRKIYRQKGTGRARHGGVRAPIFVHGGIAHGPKPQDHSLILPKNMKRAALFSALTAKLSDGSIKVVAGLENIEPKTKIIANALNGFGLSEKILVIMPGNNEIVMRAGRNLAGVTITAADRINTYEVLNAKSVVFMKEAIERLEEVFLKKA